MIISEH